MPYVDACRPGGKDSVCILNLSFQTSGRASLCSQFSPPDLIFDSERLGVTHTARHVQTRQSNPGETGSPLRAGLRARPPVKLRPSSVDPRAAVRGGHGGVRYQLILYTLLSPDPLHFWPSVLTLFFVRPGFNTGKRQLPLTALKPKRGDQSRIASDVGASDRAAGEDP